MTHATELERILLLPLTIAAFAYTPTSDATDSLDYYESHSHYFEKATGYPLTEQGLRDALEDIDTLETRHAYATISVVGEQRFASLADELKRIYYRTADDNPDPANPKFYSRYKEGNILTKLRVRVARALVLCGDPDATKLAIEQALAAPEMNSIPAKKYAIRTLKYLVSENQEDVSPELTFLITSYQNAENPSAAFYAAHELIEIERYLQETESDQLETYRQAIESIRPQLSAPLRRAFDERGNVEPAWDITKSIIRERESAQ